MEKEKKKSAPRGAPQGASGCFGASSESVLRIIVTFVLGTPAISNSRHTVNLKYVRHIYACTELRTRLRCLLARCLLARCFRERPIRFLLLIPRVIPLQHAQATICTGTSPNSRATRPRLRLRTLLRRRLLVPVLVVLTATLVTWGTRSFLLTN